MFVIKLRTKVFYYIHHACAQINYVFSINKSGWEGLLTRIKLASQARSNLCVHSTLPSIAGIVFTDLQALWRHHNDLGYYFVARGAETNICWSLHQSERGSVGRTEVSARVTQVRLSLAFISVTIEEASADKLPVKITASVSFCYEEGGTAFLGKARMYLQTNMALHPGRHCHENRKFHIFQAVFHIFLVVLLSSL